MMSTKRIIEIVVGVLSIISAITFTIIANNEDDNHTKSPT